MLAASTGTGQWQLRRRDAVAVIAGGVVAVIIDDVPGQWRLRPGVVGDVGGGGGNVGVRVHAVVGLPVTSCA